MCISHSTFAFGLFALCSDFWGPSTFNQCLPRPFITSSYVNLIWSMTSRIKTLFGNWQPHTYMYIVQMTMPFACFSVSSSHSIIYYWQHKYVHTYLLIPPKYKVSIKKINSCANWSSYITVVLDLFDFFSACTAHCSSSSQTLGTFSELRISQTLSFVSKT